VIVDTDVAPWGADVVVEAMPGERVRNEVVAVRVDGRPAVALRSRRSGESLDWELDLVEHLDRCGPLVPVALPTRSGARRIGTLTVRTWLDGQAPASERDWRQVERELNRLYDVTAGWPQRPGFASRRKLLTVERGGDVDLSAMPSDAVAACRSVWAALPETSRAHVVHGDPGRTNVRISDAGVGLLDWDEARVDHPWLDLADLSITPVSPAQATIAERAATAWEAANGWIVEPDYARSRLQQLITRT
jgi:Ser/Thr protein kinase RdoA (MazF antagonist)